MLPPSLMTGKRFAPSKNCVAIATTATHSFLFAICQNLTTGVQPSVNGISTTDSILFLHKNLPQCVVTVGGFILVALSLVFRGAISKPIKKRGQLVRPNDIVVTTQLTGLV